MFNATNPVIYQTDCVVLLQHYHRTPVPYYIRNRRWP